MPFNTFEGTLEGVGDDALSGARVLYFAWEVTAEGMRVRRPMEGDTDHLAGVGFIQFGNDVTSGGILSGVAWSEPIWLNSVLGQWIAPPGLVGSSFSYALAQRIRWSIGVGTTVHLYVFGDS